MLQSPGQVRGGQQQGGGFRIESLWPGWRKDALYWWESIGGSFLARGRTASVYLSLMSLQRSACCFCAASNCCPGLVSSQYLISIKCTCRWFTSNWWGCLTRLAVVVLCVGLCLPCNA
eukprot:1141697-Pelagomonas_calceolata.AAC.2